MTYYEHESYENGSQAIAAVARTYGPIAAGKEALGNAYLATEHASCAACPSRAFSVGAIDTAIGALLDARANGKL